MKKRISLLLIFVLLVCTRAYSLTTYIDDLDLEGAMTAATSTFTLILVGTPTPPSVTYNAGNSRYDALCSALSYGGNDYNQTGGPLEHKYSLWLKTYGPNVQAVGTPLALVQPEPVDLFVAVDGDMDFDGTTNIDIILAHNGSVYYTFVCATANRAQIVADLITASATIDLEIASVFTQNGAGNPYTFNLSAITGAGATLWGDDGAGGERLSGGTINSSALPSSIGTFAITSDFTAGLAAALATSTVTGELLVVGNISPTNDDFEVWTSGPATRTIAINSNFQGRGAIIGYDIASSTAKTFILSAGNSAVAEEHAYLCLGDTCSDTGIGLHLNGNAGITAWVASPDNVVVEISAEDRPLIDIKAGINVKNPVSEDLMFLVDADNGNIWSSGTLVVNTIATHLIPTTDVTYDLGSASNQWRAGYFASASIHIGDVSLIDRNDCLATTDFTALGQGSGSAGKLKLATGTAPIEHTEAGFVQLYPMNDKLYLMESGGTEREIAAFTSDGYLQVATPTENNQAVNLGYLEEYNNIYFATSNGESSTTLIQWQGKATATFTPSSTGTYIISYSTIMAISDTGKEACLRVLEDGTIIHQETHETASINYVNGGWMNRSGFFIVTLSPSQHEFAIQWTTCTAGKTAYIKEASIIARKVDI